MNCTLSARRLLISRKNWLYLRRERLHLSARSKHSGSHVASVQRPQCPECVRRSRMIARPSHGACVESQIARPSRPTVDLDHIFTPPLEAGSRTRPDIIAPAMLLPASKSAAALAASKES